MKGKLGVKDRLKVLVVAFVIAVAGGAFGVLFGWWLYDGSTSGDFTCSISFVPCQLAGLLVILGGIGWAGFFALVGMLGALGRASKR